MKTAYRLAVQIETPLTSFYILRQFRAEGGLPRLVELLRSGNDDVRRSVAWAVLQCGNDLPTATEICRLG